MFTAHPAQKGVLSYTVSGIVRMPRRALEAAHVQAILRLRSTFASREPHSAQDDTSLNDASLATRYTALGTLVLTLPQILVFVSQIVSRVAHDRLTVRIRQFAAESAGRAHPERARFDDRLLRNQRACGDDRARADARAIQNDRSHTDEAAVFDDASVQRDRMADRDIFADIDAILLLHTVQHTVVLNVRVRTDTDFVHIAAEDGIHPDGSVFSEDDIADDLG
jgi:hypothetical protein